MEFIWLWLAAPLTLVAGSRPAGQSPANPALSSTVIDPPALGVPAAAVDDDVEDPDDVALAPDADEFDDDEPPHALTNAAIENRQAATAASLRKRMASLILASPPRAADSPALPAAKTRSTGGSAAPMLTRLSTILWSVWGLIHRWNGGRARTVNFGGFAN